MDPRTNDQRAEAARCSAGCWASLRIGLLSIAYAENGDVKDERAREAMFYVDIQCYAALARVRAAIDA